MHQQDRRGVRADEADRLGLARAGPLAERVAAAGFGEGIEIGRRGEQGGGADDLGVDPGVAQVMRVEREHRGFVGPRRMTGEGDPPWIAAVPRDVVACPAHRQRAVLEKGGEADFGDKAVIGDDGDEAARGEGPPDEAIVAAIARHPAAAVEEDDHRQRRCRTGGGHPHVEPLPGERPVGRAPHRGPRRAVAAEPADAVEQAGGAAPGKGKQSGRGRSGHDGSAAVDWHGGGILLASPALASAPPNAAARDLGSPAPVQRLRPGRAQLSTPLTFPQVRAAV